MLYWQCLQRALPDWFVYKNRQYLKKQKLSGRLFIKEVKYPKINTDLGMLYWQCLQRALPDWFKEDFSYLLIASDIPDSFLKMQIHYLVPFHPAS